MSHTENINATDLRQDYFIRRSHFKELPEKITSKCPRGTKNFLTAMYSHSEFAYIREENDFINAYRKSWESAPYPPVFVTVDAVVVQSGHILLVKRRARPGYGQSALPGGFIGNHERLIDACLRELREETKIKTPEAVLRGCIKKQETFDDPNRSSRGRTITHAVHIELPPHEELPKIKGGDDAEKAFWLPLADLKPEKMFEDHYFIAKHLLGLSNV